MKVINCDNKIIKSWCENPEDGAIEQAKNLTKLPFLFKHVALMPDTHQGYGMPIGGVIACDGVVVPNAVGVDIGCGMRVMKTKIRELSKEQIKDIMAEIRLNVPLGFKHHDKAQGWEKYSEMPEIDILKQEKESSQYQLGTLGGGNHFIEIQKGDDGFIYIMIHSGSRNLGYKIAKHYNKIAQDLCKQWYSNIPELKGDNGLAFLPVSSKEGQEYINAMNYALDFALTNRAKMMYQIIHAISKISDVPISLISKEQYIHDVHHNYATLEHHFGRNVWIHRKGATSARLNEIGIIPGSQGTSSFIVKGKGNIESFMSCSHGAGRKMGRKQAQMSLSLDKEKDKLESQGIIHSIRNTKDLDEASGAYKDIHTVMEEQKDLIEIVTELHPLAVIKG